MTLFSKILLATATSTSFIATISQAYVLEFANDPIPEPLQLWQLGDISIDKKLNLESDSFSEFSLNLIKDSRISDEFPTSEQPLTGSAYLEAMKNVSIGMASLDTFTKQPNFYCCPEDLHEPNATCPKDALASSKDRKDVYMKSLASTVKKDAKWNFRIANPGKYKVFIANCNKVNTSLQDYKWSGSIRIKHPHGFMSLYEIKASRTVFALGFVYLAIAVVFLLYPFEKSVSSIVRTYAFFATAGAVRLLLAIPYDEFLKNTNGDFSAEYVPSFASALHLFMFMMLWDRLNSQYGVSTDNIQCKDKFILCCGFVACIWMNILTLHIGGHKSTHLPSEFVKNPSVFDGRKNQSYFEVFSSFDFLIRFGAVLVLICPFFIWCERRASETKDSPITKLLVDPLRGKLMVLVVCMNILLFFCESIFSTVISTESSSSDSQTNGTTAIASNTESFSSSYHDKSEAFSTGYVSLLNIMVEVAILSFTVYFGIYFFMSYKEIYAVKYSAVAGCGEDNIGVGNGIEMQDFDRAEDEEVDNEVDNYDPDELANSIESGRKVIE